MPSSNRVIRWGILGTARIATKVAAAIRKADGAELAAIASRSSQRASVWANEHGAARSVASYEALLDAADIDALYIPLPPSLHAEWTIRAAEHGKHVLCEKPLAATVAEAEDMAAACRENRVQLMDGVMWLHHPRARQMLEPIRDGSLGELKRVTSAFTFYWSKIPKDEFRLDRSLGGGALLDLGWYCVGASLWAFGELPQRVWGSARFRRDVDMNFSAVLWFDGDRVASFDCGFDVGMRKWFEVAGTAASLVCDDFTNPWDVQKARFWLHDAGGKTSEKIAPARVQEVCMIEDFCEIIRGGELSEDWPRAAVATQLVCEALDRSARGGEIVELQQV
jgi:predicted dehydrogenase